MGCFILLLALISPRLVLFLVWVFYNALFDRIFSGSFIWPLLGFIFVPWTTLMWLFTVNPVIGRPVGWGWFWIILALLIDIGCYGSSKYARKSPVK